LKRHPRGLVLLGGWLVGVEAVGSCELLEVREVSWKADFLALYGQALDLLSAVKIRLGTLLGVVRVAFEGPLHLKHLIFFVLAQSGVEDSLGVKLRVVLTESARWEKRLRLVALRHLLVHLRDLVHQHEVRLLFLVQFERVLVT